MGKFQDELNALYERRDTMERIYCGTMDTYGYLMDSMAKQYNEQRHAASMRALNQKIAALEPAARKEQAEEMAEVVLEQIAKGSGKAAQQIKAEIDKIFK